MGTYHDRTGTQRHAARLLVIEGSPRRGGNTEHACAYLLERLQPSFLTQIVHLRDLDIRRCTGCRACMKENGCSIKDDDFEDLWASVLGSDVIVQACPVYWHSPPGLMKDFVDRTHAYYPDHSQLQGKRGYIVSVATDSGFETNEAVLASWIVSYGGSVPGRARLLARDLGDLEKRAQNLADLDALTREIEREAGRPDRA